MKKLIPALVLVWALSMVSGGQQCLAANNIGSSNSGATNANYACQPPYLTQNAKPNIHFVLDYTGSMNYYPYIQTSSTYNSSNSYYGYFKQDMYYQYDTSTTTGMSPTNGFWTENTSCTNTDHIGQSGCVSGRLLNYLTSNKVDILRKVLTGGRVASGSTDVLEHEAGDSFNTGRIASEATTKCLFDAGPSSLTGQEQISSTSYTITTTSTVTDSYLKVDVSSSDETFTRSAGDFTANYAVGDTVQVSRPGSYAISTNNDGTFTVTAVSQYKLTVNGNLGTSETNKYAIFTKITYTPAAAGCQVLAKTISKTMTINASTKTFTRTDGGSFVSDGWVAGMTLVASGFRSISNNGTFTVASVTASTLTINENTLFTDSNNNTGSFLQNTIYAYTRVKTSTPADITGTIQYIYTGPTSTANKADMEISFFSTDYGVTYAPTAGGTTYDTTKNQAQSNYINAINRLPATGGTNTRQAMTAAEKFFQSDNSSTGIRNVASMPSGWPSSGTSTKGNASYDPFYDSGNVATPCRKSFVILATDGDWNSPDTTYASDPAYVAYDMHVRNSTYDLRPETGTTSAAGYDTSMVGQQNVTTYGIYLLDDSTTGKNALKTLSIFGGFNDIDKNNLPYPFTTSPPSSSTGRYKTVTNTTGWSTSLNVSYNPMTECNDPTRWDSTSTVSCKEWDTSPSPHTNLPYNYFEASDGDQVASSILNAVNDILERVSSGTAASILGNNDNAGSQLLQAMFYPIKTFESYTKATWLGELQSYWYFVDPTLRHVTIREDTVNDLKLNLKEDRIVEFNFDGTYTKVRLYNDANGDGTKDSTTFQSEVDPDDVKTLWQAGTKLFCTNEADRVIFTNDPTASTATKISFNDTASSGSTTSKLKSYLDVTSNAGAYDVIKYTRGSDVDTAYRNRTVRYTTSTCNGTSGTYTQPWKLGDIVNSTPKILTEVRLNSYNLSPASGYSDTTYTRFVSSSDYNARGLAFVGANDGMLHAFKTGSNFNGTTTNVVAELKNANGTAVSDLGKELWAFVPKNVLPYLQYLSLSNYSHMYFLDSTPIIADVSINVTGDTSITCNSSTYSTCALKTTLGSGNTLSYDTSSGGTSWRTVLIGSMGLGGATRVNPVTTASTSITINASGKTFTRSSGSFLTDGWTVGKVFSTSGFSNAGNNGPFAITSVTATVITCAGAGLVSETSASGQLYESQAVRVPVTASNGPSTLGYSSVFALDITSPSGSTIGTDSSSYPQLLWEFTDPRLGFTTVTPAIMRIKDANETPSNPTRRNGKWFAILASGPTGAISSGNFYGNSDLPLTIFVLDLKTGNIVRTFNNLAAGHTLNAASSTVHTQITAMPSFAFGGSLSASGIDVDKKYLSQTGNYSDDALYIGFTKADFTQTPAQWNKGGVLRLLTYNDPDPSHWSISPVIDDIGPVTSSVTRLQDITAHNLWLYFGTGRYYSKGDDQTNIQSLFGIKEPCYAASDSFSGSYSTPCTTKIAATSTSTGVSGSTLVDQSGTPGTVASSKDGWFINLGTPTGSYAKRVVTDPIASYNGLVTFSTFAPSTDVCSYGGSTSVWEVQYNTGGAPPANMMGQLLIQLSTGAFQQVDLTKDFTLSSGRETVAFKGTPPKDKPSMTSNANHFPSKRILHIRER